MEKNISRRDAVKVLAGLVIGSSVGCALRETLPTNVAQNFEEGQICVNEDIIRMQKEGILGDWYFNIPLNEEGRILNGGEPSFALIPELRARTSIKHVGEKGGEVFVDAPKGDLYLPYAVFKSKDGKIITQYPKESVQPLKLVTSLKLKDSKRPCPNQGKIALEDLTEKDFPFSDETLITTNKNTQYDEEKVVAYVVNKMNDRGTSFPNEKENILPIYFTKTPFFVDYDRTEKDKRIRIGGLTYIFKKGETREDYIRNRGLVRKSEEDKITKRWGAEID